VSISREDQPPSSAVSPTVRQKADALARLADAADSKQDLAGVFGDLTPILAGALRFDVVWVGLHQPAAATFRVQVIENAVGKEPSVGSELNLPIEESAAGWVWRHQAPLVFADTGEEATRFPGGLALLRQLEIRASCWVPLTAAERHIGILGFGSVRPHAFDDVDLGLLHNVANLVATATDAATSREQAAALQRQLAHERDRLRVLLDATNALVLRHDVAELGEAISRCVRQLVPHEFSTLGLPEGEGRLRQYTVDFGEGAEHRHEEVVFEIAGTVSGEAYTTRRPLLVAEFDPARYPGPATARLLARGLRSGCAVPLITEGRVLGVLGLASRQPNQFSPQDLELLEALAGQIAIAIDNALAFREIETLKNRLAEENLYLEDEIRSQCDFEEMVGESRSLGRVLAQIETVAGTDSTVLILGETGTGKELVARAIHGRSPRRGRALVKVNCAAIPSGLLESELFGHEKGAFTGAIERKSGRFELAHQGTLFLDEVGDIPLELQPKLLRVLQEKEFERLGSTRSLRADVRLIAATNRDLPALVADRQFRADLYYRLNVFPIQVPPLRERSEDIPLLVRHFAQKIARAMRKPLETVHADDLKALGRWHWPGNVRELENLVERAVILSRGPVLHIPWPGLDPAGGARFATGDQTLEAVERQHILRVLNDTGGVIGGPAGAAARLGLKRTTLQSRLRALGIHPSPSAPGTGRDFGR
jgi:formate hydrogenlyase transcriptional activator